LIADGRSHDNVVTPSNNLKATGVIVYAVGIGGFDVNELRAISTDPDDEHVFLLNSFRDAAGFVDFLSVTTCESMYHAVINILRLKIFRFCGSECIARGHENLNFFPQVYKV
jgi:hypothetical protein